MSWVKRFTKLCFSDEILFQKLYFFASEFFLLFFYLLRSSLKNYKKMMKTESKSPCSMHFYDGRAFCAYKIKIHALIEAYVKLWRRFQRFSKGSSSSLWWYLGNVNMRRIGKHTIVGNLLLQFISWLCHLKHYDGYSCMLCFTPYNNTRSILLSP